MLYRIVARASLRLRRQAAENYRLARRDQLTGLPNRISFGEEVARAVRGAGGEERPVVLLIDLERFSSINGTLGDANGDAVLRAVARRLEGIGGACAARLGGDEFALLLTDRPERAPALAERALAAIEAPVALDEVAVDVEASVGVAVLGEHADDASALLVRADLALAHARSQGSRIEVYAPGMERADPARLRLLGQVREALSAGEFILHYQPKVDLLDRRIRGVEALVRWQHPELGLLSPDRFVPLVEQTALVGPLAREVTAQALRQAAAWHRRGISITVAVNLSARNLLDRDLPRWLDQLLREHGVPASALVVEITESAAMVDPDRAVAVLAELRALGVGISIDDFGTGNASLRVPLGPAGDRAEDRPQLRQRDRIGPARPRDRALDDRPRAELRADGRRRGDRGRGDARLPPRGGVPDGSGLPVLPAAARRAADPAACGRVRARRQRAPRSGRRGLRRRRKQQRGRSRTRRLSSSGGHGRGLADLAALQLRDLEDVP